MSDRGMYEQEFRGMDLWFARVLLFFWEFMIAIICSGFQLVPDIQCCRN